MTHEYPRIRPVEAIPDPDNHRVVLRDPTQLAAGMLVVGYQEFTLLTLLDGRRRRTEIQAEYLRQVGRMLPTRDLEGLIEQLAEAGFLQGPAFEAYYAGLAAEYRNSPYRALRDADGFGVPAARLPEFLDEALDGAAASRRGATPAGKLVGLVAPHLDFPRGLPCYADGYAALRSRTELPRRVVVLGTNHFGRSNSVVATGKDFETPWGVLPTDREFLERLEGECGGNLRPYEMDHLREHSIELHAVWLHHVLGPDVRIVPFLCPDPSGPRGTRPGDPDGVDLQAFSVALGRLVRSDPEPTLFVASADLSHVGRYFDDDVAMDDGFLHSVREQDEAGLALIDRNDPEAYRKHMARTGNPTRVCSVGCLYALMTALGPESRAHRLRYHQAVTREAENTVTCAAYAFYG